MSLVQQPSHVNVPGAEEIQMDRLMAVKAACQLTGPSRDAALHRGLLQACEPGVS